MNTITTAQEKKVEEQPQEKNLNQQQTKVVNMVFNGHIKRYGNLDFIKILRDYGVRYCPPQGDGLLF